MNKAAMNVLLRAILAATFFANGTMAQATLHAYGDQYRSVGDQIGLEELKLLAVDGNTAVQYTLGTMYHSGRGVMQDYKAAASWYLMAAQQGHAAAQYNLGTMHFLGQGVVQDYAAAAGLFRMAAEQGLAEAQNTLGIIYFKGEGIPPDLVQACMWFTLAALGGHKKARATQKHVEGYMSREQIEKARMLVQEWLAKHP